RTQTKPRWKGRVETVDEPIFERHQKLLADRNPPPYPCALLSRLNSDRDVYMTTLVYTIYILICLFLVAVVLLQPGKAGAGLGSTFGGGGNTVFGARGATTLLQKVTVGAATMFMLLSLLLAVLSRGESVTDSGTDTEELPSEGDLGTPS